jgi:hypothetical protein
MSKSDKRKRKSRIVARTALDKNAKQKQDNEVLLDQGKQFHLIRSTSLRIEGALKPAGIAKECGGRACALRASINHRVVRKFVEWPPAPRVHEMQHVK